MTFQQRFAYTSNTAGNDGSEVWEEYAVTATTGIITITGTTNDSLTAWSMIGYGVQGADIAAPFDNSSGISHADFSECNAIDGCAVTFSTTSADTLAIFGIGSDGNPTFVPPTHFTLIQSVTAPGWSANGVAYQVFSSPQKDISTGDWGMTGSALGCTQTTNPPNSCGESALWYVDVIQACMTSCPAPISYVAQPISINMSNYAPSSNVSVNGCFASPSTFASDGSSHLITMISPCSFTLSFSNAGNTRDGFSASGTFDAISQPQSSCAAGTCPPILLTAYQQLQNTYGAKPDLPGTWDAGLVIPVFGTQLGVAGRTGCSISSVKDGQVASCTAWFDYGTPVKVAATVAVSGIEQWAQSGGANFTQTTGGNHDTVGFIDQFQISFIVSPRGEGSTSPFGSKVWENYGPLAITAAPSSGFLFNTWSAVAGLTSFAPADKASTTATILASGNITATFSTPVTQPITLTLAEQQGSPADFTLSGCSIESAPLSGDGASHSFDVLPSCKLTVTVASAGPDVRYGFTSGGAFSNATSVLTCPAQTCTEFSTTYYEQVSQRFAYAVVGGAAPYVQAPVLSFSALGTPTTYTVTGDLTTQWLDFGSSWSLANPLPGSSGAERSFAPNGASGTATAGGNQTVTYQNQFSVLIAASPAPCGSTTPSGANWENSGDSFQVTASAGPDCAFSAWEVTGLVTVPQAGQPATTAFADSNGTLTASFSRDLSPAFPTSTLIIITGVGVIAAVSVGILVVRSRAYRSRTPHV
jgi:hypothetical protein